jgi:hypothetical protein
MQKTVLFVLALVFSALMVVTSLVWALEIQKMPVPTQPLNPQIKSTAPRGPFTYKIVFVTSQLYKANFGGLAAADAICQATAGGAGLKGTYKAWLSTGRRVTGSGPGIDYDRSISPATRFTHSQVPYITVDGRTVAASWQALVSGQALQPSVDGNIIANSINIDEHGNPIANTGIVFRQWSAWTGTEFDGKGVRSTEGNCSGQWNIGCANCSDWTIDAKDQYGFTGFTFGRGKEWTGEPYVGGVYSYLSCDNSAHFYCFQQ